jgi:nitrogen fixation protein FixH
MLARLLGIRAFTGWHMAGVMALLFGSVIAANATLAVMASRTWTGLVVKNSYVASAHFEADTARRVQGAAQGWHLTAAHEPGRLLVTVTDADGPVRGIELTGRAGRPSHDREDRSLVFEQRGEGYEASVDLGPGVWIGEVEVRRPDAALTTALRFTVPR